jgi:pimeloyl-ACP methyl ester carboxylesterase
MGYRFAQLYPERVSHLALVGIMWRVSRRQREDAFAHVEQLDTLHPNDFATEVIDRLLTPFDREKVQRAKLVERVLRAELKRLDADGMQKYRANILRLITQPPLDVESPPTSRSLIFTGEYDHFTRPRYGRALAARMKDCAFTIIEEADHLCHMERSESATALVRKFFHDEPLVDIPGCRPAIRCGDQLAGN